MTPLFEICVQKKKMKDIVIQTINLIISSGQELEWS